MCLAIRRCPGKLTCLFLMCTLAVLTVRRNENKKIKQKFCLAIYSVQKKPNKKDPLKTAISILQDSGCKLLRQY